MNFPGAHNICLHTQAAMLVHVLKRIPELALVYYKNGISFPPDLLAAFLEQSYPSLQVPSFLIRLGVEIPPNVRWNEYFRGAWLNKLIEAKKELDQTKKYFSDNKQAIKGHLDAYMIPDCSNIVLDYAKPAVADSILDETAKLYRAIEKRKLYAHRM